MCHCDEIVQIVYLIYVLHAYSGIVQVVRWRHHHATHTHIYSIYPSVMCLDPSSILDLFNCILWMESEMFNSGNRKTRKRYIEKLLANYYKRVST